MAATMVVAEVPPVPAEAEEVMMGVTTMRPPPPLPTQPQQLRVMTMEGTMVRLQCRAHL